MNRTGGIPDIIEFTFSPHWLNVRASGIANLYPVQTIILKSFYRGSIGNENLTLTEEELDKLKKLKHDNIIDKYHDLGNFRELVLVLGRRSGKNLMTSIVALYEAMKLIEIPGGSPYEYYGIARGAPVYVLGIASAAEQAQLLFSEIRTRAQSSDYFKRHMVPGAIGSQTISLLTPEDREVNRQLDRDGLPEAKTKGSVVIYSGHSNSNSLVGKRCIMLVMDEVASYPQTSGPSSGDALYQQLVPMTADFKRKVGQTEDGKDRYRLDSKIIAISSPRGEEGLLFRLYSNARRRKSRLAYKLPTWDVNMGVTKEMLFEEYPELRPVEFNMQFGAEFSGTSGEKFIPDRYVDDAIELGRVMGVLKRPLGERGLVYYAHLDPASRSHNFALVILHIEEYIRERVKADGRKAKEVTKVFVVDHLMVWEPGVKESINVKEVEDYIVGLSKKFKFATVTYDAWNSPSSKDVLQRHGIPNRETAFRKHYKMGIYDQLEDLLVNNQIALPAGSPRYKEAELLELELKSLKRQYTANGFQIKPDENGLVQTDDLCDALAGAVGSAMGGIYDGYPKGAVAYMPAFRSGGANRPWLIGRGVFNNQEIKTLGGRFGMF